MSIAKAIAKENQGKYVRLSITKVSAKVNPLIFICNRLRAAGALTLNKDCRQERCFGNDFYRVTSNVGSTVAENSGSVLDKGV